MQDRYAGDIGDFGKYGLLRYILDRTDIKLGINWYLVPNEAHNDDGKHIAYLLNEKQNHTKYRSCDNNLYDMLHNIVKPKRIDKRKVESLGQRQVDQLENSHIFSRKKVLFYNARLTPKIDRDEWFKNSFKSLKNCDAIFFDPDNGLEVESCPKNRKKSVKYSYYDEVVDYLIQRKSLIIYQHRDMKPEKEFYGRFLTLLKKTKKMHVQCNIFSIRFNRYSVREFVFVLQKKHSKIKDIVVNSFMRSKWGVAIQGAKKPHFTFGREL